MKSILFIISMLVGGMLAAQSFSEISPSAPFIDVSASAVEFADVDGDGDLDVLISGYNGSHGLVRLYTNDGAGNYTEVPNTLFQDLEAGSITFADIDGDNDQDVLTTGRLKAFSFSILYKNDGTGAFTRVLTPFVGVEFSETVFLDVDGDNDQDVLITGIDDTTSVAKLYLNDGSGNFTEKANTPFVGAVYSAIDFADIDGDNDLDILITGGTSKLYTNDGSGNYTEVANTPFRNVNKGGVAFSDVDGDNDQDVLITGDDEGGFIATLYTNDGSGKFTEKMNTPFAGLISSDVSFSDVDSDNDQDVLIIGYNTVTAGRKESVATLYTNDGNGNFTEAVGMPFTGAYDGTIDFADVDGDNDPDVLITGDASAKLYINNTIISSVENDLPGLDFVLFADPSGFEVMNLRITSEEPALMTLSVFDVNGRLLFSQQHQAGAGEQKLTFSTASLQPGNYILQLDNGKLRAAHRFVVR